jgi:hypothetical protein
LKRSFKAMPSRLPKKPVPPVISAVCFIS